MYAPTLDINFDRNLAEKAFESKHGIAMFLLQRADDVADELRALKENWEPTSLDADQVARGHRIVELNTTHEALREVGIRYSNQADNLRYLLDTSK